MQGNPYLQYFVGISTFKDEPPFAPSLFVEICKRMGADVFASFEQVILQKIGNVNPPQEYSSNSTEEGVKNKGKMLVDATVAEQAIRYPTDISLLNEAREISEQLIDELYSISDLATKPRTYRQKARRQYLAIA